MTLRRLTRPIRHRFITGVLKGLTVVVAQLPKTWIRFLGSTIGCLIGLTLRRASKEIRNRLDLAGFSHVRVQRTWADLGRRLFEFLALHRFVDDVVIDPAAIALFRQLQQEGMGVLIATAHIGNWELMAAALASKGYAPNSIAGQPSPGPVNAALEDIRRGWGVTTLHKGRGARQAYRLLRRGQTVAVFCDQTTKERSRDVLFLGQPAATPVTFERLQKLTESSALLVWNIYDGGRYTIFAEVIPVSVDQTEWIQRRLSDTISKHPTQWVWLHDRWSKKKSALAPPIRLSYCPNHAYDSFCLWAST